MYDLSAIGSDSAGDIEADWDSDKGHPDQGSVLDLSGMLRGGTLTSSSGVQHRVDLLLITNFLMVPCSLFWLGVLAVRPAKGALYKISLNAANPHDMCQSTQYTCFT